MILESLETSRSASRPFLFSSDFDGTIALTSEVLPGGTDVNGAYAQAIESELGDEAALAFRGQGGHSHRTPLEIVQAVAPGLSQDRLIRSTDAVTNGKLEILLDQIGKPMADGVLWPRPTDGFTDLWQAINDAQESGVVLPTAIISAGHTAFIEAWFDKCLQLPRPDSLITADVFRGLSLSIAPEAQAKPSPLLMHLAQVSLGFDMSTTPPTIYAGDDPIKDGGFAKNCGVEFILIEKGKERPAWQRVADFLRLGELSVSQMVAHA